MRRLLTLGMLTVALLGLASPEALAAPRRQAIDVVTQNLYFGADLAPVLGAPSVPEAIAAVGAVFAAVQASAPAERMAVVAEEIASRRPNLIGLQEASVWRSGAPGTEATTVEFDLVALLLDALLARGLVYTVIATTTNVDVQLPGLTAAGLREIRFTDREVILARAGFGSGVILSDVQTGTFATKVTVATPFGPFDIRRGWASVDVTIGDQPTFRFITTHLESLHPLVQVGQAVEILTGPAATAMPVVLVCDCNSSASGEGPDATPTYAMLRDAGFGDAWAARHPGAPGHTCCHDASLASLPSGLVERIDYVLFRGPFAVRDADVLGARASDRTPKPRRWSSDHAGVAATLELR